MRIGHTTYVNLIVCRAGGAMSVETMERGKARRRCSAADGKPGVDGAAVLEFFQSYGGCTGRPLLRPSRTLAQWGRTPCTS